MTARAEPSNDFSMRAPKTSLLRPRPAFVAMPWMYWSFVMAFVMSKWPSEWSVSTRNLEVIAALS